MKVGLNGGGVVGNGSSPCICGAARHTAEQETLQDYLNAMKDRDCEIEKVHSACVEGRALIEYAALDAGGRV